MTNSIELPWPPKALNPNARVHWAKKAKAAKAYRAGAFIFCKLACVKLPKIAGKLHLWLDFYPPDKRVRDADNLLAAAKPMVDGIAEHFQINDTRFIFHPVLMDEVVKNGCVKVRITAEPI